MQSTGSGDFKNAHAIFVRPLEVPFWRPGSWGVIEVIKKDGLIRPGN